jgi:hypothetical protein
MPKWIVCLALVVGVVLLIFVEESIYYSNGVYLLSGFTKALGKKVRSLKEQKHVNLLS